jgi:alcohol dehydrogenase
MLSRSLLLAAPRQLQWVARELPPLGPHDLLIETRAGAISIGSELPHYRGTSRNSAPATYPRMTGYENVGIVLARGAAVRRVRVGDRVVSFYGHRTHAVVPERKAIVVPPQLDDALALLLILSGDVATGVRKLGPARREPVLVTGAGAIGLLSVFVLTALGAPVVAVVEPRAARRALALQLGAGSAVAPEAIGSTGAYAGGLECSSSDAAFALLQTRLRHGGRICILADGNIEPLTLAPDFHERELAVGGSSDCPDYHAHARWYFTVARRAAPALAQLFDLHVPADELPDTFERLAAGATEAIKVLVRYGSGQVGERDPRADPPARGQ